MDAIERLRQKAQNERTVLALNEITRLQRDEISALKAQLAAAQEELASNAKLLAIAERTLRGIAATSGGLPSDIAVEAIAAIDAARNKNA